MAKFHTLKVRDVRRETPDCVSVAFDVPEDLKDAYAYLPGQYLTLKFNFKGEELRRSYSLCSSPDTENEWRIAAKRVQGGRVSGYLNESVKVGDVVEVMTPMGNFHTPMQADRERHFVLFAGGSGITPMFSILKSALAKEPRSRITLVYANRDEASVIFAEALKQMAAEHADRLHIHFVYDEAPAGTPSLLQGMMSVEKATQILNDLVRPSGNEAYFICGPGPMMDHIKTALAAEGVSDDKVHIEYFTAVLEDLKRAESAGESQPSGDVIESEVTVIMDDEPFSFQLSSNGMSILDAASDAGVDAPFSCKGAVCCTCKAQVLEGKVTMEKNFALSDGEVAEGYVLTCQSHPATEKVVITYDVI
ncbi:MAG: 2Fe-2S iron-sulfur cluster binding domain-containing protein [Flavobacteriales bacterium]|nr:2Fe-2S iron-sulfur cluster binding domain-containing protein [Flavobacteriales bacterium]MCB9449278.1 2Fe-2S iron-sulfur cluster binding domain-containing protein [Flavobacteriales bacterium]